jgi:YggT family protein
LIAWLAEFLKNIALYALIGFRGAIPGLMLLGFADMLDFFAVLYLIMIFIWALLSFVSLDARHPLIPLLGRLVEPVLRPLRRMLPAPGGLDLSPALAILVILLLRLLIVAPLFDLGHRLSL